MKLVSAGLADQDYCLRLEEAPVMVRYLVEYDGWDLLSGKVALIPYTHGVDFIHHDETNVMIEFNTN